MAPRILIFSIAMGADYSFYVKTIETHARAFPNVSLMSPELLLTYPHREEDRGIDLAPLFL